jgi:hypothetical protein
VAQAREPQSLLGMAWGLGGENRMQLGRGRVNNAVKEAVMGHAGGVEWPGPDLKEEWKEVIGVVSNKVLRESHCQIVAHNPYQSTGAGQLRCLVEEQNGASLAPAVKLCGSFAVPDATSAAFACRLRLRFFFFLLRGPLEGAPQLRKFRLIQIRDDVRQKGVLGPFWADHRGPDPA